MRMISMINGNATWLEDVALSRVTSVPDSVSSLIHKLHWSRTRSTSYLHGAAKPLII